MGFIWQRWTTVGRGRRKVNKMAYSFLLYFTVIVHPPIENIDNNPVFTMRDILYAYVTMCITQIKAYINILYKLSNWHLMSSTWPFLRMHFQLHNLINDGEICLVHVTLSMVNAFVGRHEKIIEARIWAPATLELTPGPTGLTYISHKAARRQPKVGTDQATNVPVLVSSMSMFILLMQ